ncbi:hypothetical protein JOF29_007949 [Kribbella aluminosa]|uniref:Uncharacterized protein n=1 Tax=Kribbella aluminosa TaxID=416017 RepID=A0ABS4UYX5_9ACTN|nr:hypothetical protein [Kribbella aluminosa]MBP2356839.1 hypothetical protein [Kribbella aluminosa]
MQRLEDLKLRGARTTAPTIAVAVPVAAVAAAGTAAARAVPAAPSAKLPPVRHITERIAVLDGWIERRASGGISCHGEQVCAAYAKLRRAGKRAHRDFDGVVRDIRRLGDAPIETRVERGCGRAVLR